MGTPEELSAILPGGPISSTSVIQVFISCSSAKYFGMELVAPSTDQLLRCAVITLLTGTAYF